jgi:protein involved in polysaccharide export with SLBB domain
MTVAIGMLAFGFGGLSGCTEYRISLEEFRQLEQLAAEEAATPPTDEQLEVVKTLVDRQLGPYKVGPNDVLLVTVTSGDVAGSPPPITVRVDGDGEIYFPLAGNVSVRDMTLEEVDDAVLAAFVPAVFKDAAVHVETTVPDYTNVFVRGSVSLPGLVQLRRTERNLLFAVVGAGGATTGASGTVTLRRVRRPTEVVTLDLTKPTELQAALALDPLETGDVIDVHAAFPNTIFTGGLLNAPRPIENMPGVKMNALQAIAAAGGLRTDVTPTEATLIRRMPNGQDAHVKMDLFSLANGTAPNITLAAGDIFWVPHTLSTRIEDFINRNIFLRAGMSVNYSVTGVEYMNRAGQQSGQFNDAQSNFDPLGFLSRNAALNTLTNVPPVIP